MIKARRRTRAEQLAAHFNIAGRCDPPDLGPGGHARVSVLPARRLQQLGRDGVTDREEQSSDEKLVGQDSADYEARSYVGEAC